MKRCVALPLVLLLLSSLNQITWAESYTFNTIDVPGAVSTEALGVNNLGQIVGAFVDNSGATHAFLDTDGSFTALNIPGETQFGQIAVAISNSSQIIVIYGLSSGLFSNGVFTPITFQPPTIGMGINDAGQIVGYYGLGLPTDSWRPTANSLLSITPVRSPQAFTPSTTAGRSWDLRAVRDLLVVVSSTQMEFSHS